MASQARGRPDFERWLEGYAAYVRMVHPELGARWQHQGEEGALAFRSKTALPKLRLLDLRDMALSARQLEPLLKRLGWGVKL